jgi:hypothetical protein
MWQQVTRRIGFPAGVIAATTNAVARWSEIQNKNWCRRGRRGKKPD